MTQLSKPLRTTPTDGLREDCAADELTNRIWDKLNTIDTALHEGDWIATYKELRQAVREALATPAVGAEADRIITALSRETAVRSPIGRDAKLNELITLAMMAAFDELGKGCDLGVLRRHADRAAELWQQHCETDVTPEMIREAVAKALWEREFGTEGRWPINVENPDDWLEQADAAILAMDRVRTGRKET